MGIFDCMLDVDKLLKLLDFPDCIKVHENADPKSGTERGLICWECKDAIMGYHPDFSRNEHFPIHAIESTMKIRLTIIAFLALITVSCKENRPPVQSEETASQETPLTLTKESSSIAISKLGYSSRGKNLLENLYQEAQSNDPSLKQMEIEWVAFEDQSRDSLETYLAYLSTNHQYIANAEASVQQIQDTLLRQQMEVYLNTYQAAYDAQLRGHHSLKVK